MKAQRLDAFLARNGAGTRSEVRRAIRRGLVTVGGAVVRDAATKIADEEDVHLAGHRVAALPASAHLAFHKPAGEACSDDPREAPLLAERYPERYRHLGLHVAGRLDRDATGLVIVTSDGAFTHRLIHPRRKVPKRYRVDYRGRLAADAERACRDGFVLGNDDKPTRPAELRRDEEASDGGRATLTLHEGRFHQVKRMFATLGAEVVALHRDRIGAYDLPGELAPGDHVHLADADRAALLAGDRE